MRFGKSTSQQTDAKISDQLKISEKKVHSMNCRALIFWTVKDGFKPKVQDSNLLKSKNISKIFLFGRDG